MSVLRGDWTTRLFFGLYICVSVATFRHSAYGFASIEGGSFWWGALSALAVDAGMMLSASGLRERRAWPLIIGLVVSALASTYTQLLYSVSAASAVSVAAGAQWLGTAARTIIDLRVLALPALLPSLSVVYAFSAKGTRAEDSIEARAAQIRAMTDNKGERATHIWQLSGNGYEELSAEDVAQLARCSVAHARKAKK